LIENHANNAGSNCWAYYNTQSNVTNNAATAAIGIPGNMHDKVVGACPYNLNLKL